MNEQLSTRQILTRTALTVLPSFAFFVLAISGFTLLSMLFWASLMTLFTALLFMRSLSQSTKREEQLKLARTILLDYFQKHLQDGKQPVQIRDHLETWLQMLRSKNTITPNEYIQLHDLLTNTYHTAIASREPYREEIRDIEQRRKNLALHDETLREDDSVDDLPKDNLTDSNQK